MDYFWARKTMNKRWCVTCAACVCVWKRARKITLTDSILKSMGKNSITFIYDNNDWCTDETLPLILFTRRLHIYWSARRRRESRLSLFKYINDNNNKQQMWYILSDWTKMRTRWYRVHITRLHFREFRLWTVDFVVVVVVFFCTVKTWNAKYLKTTRFFIVKSFYLLLIHSNTYNIAHKRTYIRQLHTHVHTHIHSVDEGHMQDVLRRSAMCIWILRLLTQTK